MKRILIFVVLLCVLSMVYSQNSYRKMFVAGRTWNMMKAEGHTLFTPDNLVAGMAWDSTFTSFTIPKEADVTRSNFFREEGPKVYQDWGEGWVLVFDFSLNVGDNFMGLNVESVDTIEVKGRQYRRLSFGMKLEYGDFGKDKEYCWVEGIGCSLSGPYNDIYPSKLSSGITDESVLSVYDGDELIFEEDDFMAPAVTAIRTVSCDTPDKSTSLFDLSGRRLTVTPQRGVYIREGKKYVVK